MSEHRESPPVTTTSRQQRFIVFYKESILSIRTQDVACFSIEDGLMFLTRHDGRKYPLKKTMRELEESIDPYQFFKVNRSTLLSFDSIERVEAFFGQRAVVFLRPSGKVIVSKSRLAAFMEWLDS